MFDNCNIELCPLSDVRALYENGHYLRRVRVGRQLNYAIDIDGRLAGAICYALPMMRTGYLGLSSNEMIEFARLFLVRNAPGLAVFSIAHTLRRVKNDWLTMYPLAPSPRLVVSYHDTALHSGTVYKAANFYFYRLTRPRKRGPNRYVKDRVGNSGFEGARSYTVEDSRVKGTWLYPLDKRMRRVLMKLPVDNRT